MAILLPDLAMTTTGTASVRPAASAENAARPTALVARGAESASPALSVVVPVFDEADGIGPLAEEIFSVLSGTSDFEVVLVDDGSRDGTLAVLRTLRARLGPRIRIVRHARNLGQSTAICSGVRAARGAVIVTLDGDGQNDPGDIPKLLQALGDDHGGRRMVIGERIRRHDTWLRRVSSRVANRVRSAVLGDGVRDTGCGLKVFTRDTFLALPQFDHMHRFLPALVLARGGKVCCVPVGHRPRTAGKSKYGLHDRLWAGIIDLLGVTWLARRRVSQDAGNEELS